MGGTEETDYGDYFSFAALAPTYNYSGNTYKGTTTFVSTSEVGLQDIQGTDYDVATNEWGSKWMIPNYDQMTLLVDTVYVTHEYQEDYNGHTGWLFKGATDEYANDSIFIPSAGTSYYKLTSGKYVQTHYMTELWGKYHSSTRLTKTTSHILTWADSTKVSIGQQGNGSSVYPNGLSIRPITLGN